MDDDGWTVIASLEQENKRGGYYSRYVRYIIIERKADSPIRDVQKKKKSQEDKKKNQVKI